MPWYRVGGTMCHLKFGGKAAKNPPAPCAARLATTNPIVPSIRCAAISTLLCDHELTDGKTCDAPLCPDHAKQVGPDRHLCPRHAEQLERQPDLL